MRVTSPDGRRWRVRRVWFRPYWPRLGDVLFVRPPTVLVAALSIGVQFLLAPFVVAWRISVGRPVRIEARTRDKPVDARAWEAGLRDSGRVLRTIRGRIAAGTDFEVRIEGARPVPYDRA